MRQKSWFSGSRLSIEKVLALTYAWAHKFTTTQAVHETSLDDETTLTETVIDWYNFCREVCAHRTGAPNENIVENHLNIALLKVF